MASGFGIATQLNFAPIAQQRSYWATHFVSLLECLRYHNTLQWPGSKMTALGKTNWSMSELRAAAPQNFFSLIYQSMNNWGFQYFLVTLLNSRESQPIVQGLINQISSMWGIQFKDALNTYKFHISGKDSNLSTGLGLLMTDVFPSLTPLDLKSKKSIMDNSDLCLIMTQEGNVGAERVREVGIFGEVEGLHGDFLTRNGYWKNKSDYCVFAFGVVKEKGNGVFMNVRNIGGINRILTTFQAEHFVVNDFLSALWWMNNIFQNGPYVKLPPFIGDEEGYFLNMILNNFNTDVIDLIKLMSVHINQGDVLDSVPGVSTIITNIRA